MGSWIVLGLGVVVYVLVVVWAAGRLPATDVPLHFTGSGAADRLGTAGDAITAWVVLGSIMIAISVGALLAVQRAPLRRLNVPYRDHWTAPEHVPTLRRMLAADASVVLSATLVVLTLMPVSMLLGARSSDGSVPPFLLWGPLSAYVLAVVAWTYWLVRHRYRPADTAGRSSEDRHRGGEGRPGR
ncbi:MAG: hypothetical protein ABS81_13740 [Pseudonocardia sp. SCN 72-86]|nr:MAG: hypothetical protein ABS81_13740 [Pseudonocardia sp. SCN 72-86]